MTATKHRLGRDPELHEIHETIAQANGYTGKPGEITLNRSTLGSELAQLRAHDGQKQGGKVIGLVDVSSLASLYGYAVAIPPVTVTVTDGNPINFNHQLGYIPMVQVLDPMGGIVQPSAVVHSDVENTSITFSPIGTYTVIFR